MDDVASHFTGWDWAVIALYLVLTTWVGHKLSGKQATIREFFLAGRRLPWPAVCGSIIATEISALTFIGVPAMVYAAQGNFTYLQWAIGSIFARWLVGRYLVPRYYAEEIFSPYDYIQSRLGEGTKTLTTVMFFLGSILGQSVRLLVTALILRTVTGLDFYWCIFAITAFAVLWTWMGGMTTVIWTDVIQFAVFVLGGLLALGWMVAGIDGGWGELVRSAGEAGKLRLIDLSTDPAVEFTLWVGLLAMPFQNLAAFGTDQLNAQRMFCCRTPEDASKAILWSSFSQVVTVLMLFVGAGLFVYYQQHPLSAGAAALVAQDGDYIFPIWITQVLPPGLSGLVLAGAFAAAISSLDGVLTALTQTTLSLFGRMGPSSVGQEKRLIRDSRWLVAGWGLALGLCALGLNAVREGTNLVSLAFGMVSYTYGPLLGILLLALSPWKPRRWGMWLGLALSVLLTLYVRPDLYRLLEMASLTTKDQNEAFRPDLTYAWMYPVTCGIMVFCGWLSSKTKQPTET
jgi:solute:Na+ symporter, SSS family